MGRPAEQETYTFEGNFQLTVANPKIVGRAVTMRYLPVRPD